MVVFETNLKTYLPPAPPSHFPSLLPVQLVLLSLVAGYLYTIPQMYMVSRCTRNEFRLGLMLAVPVLLRQRLEVVTSSRPSWDT